ncbi:MAG: DUF4091 domain-containing protein [Ruminococcaceae bacterium]|nr:DUF4091 domain-containing protein [Oscillospiraceae bacterium]
MIISSAMKKLFRADDCEIIERGVCLSDQGFQFQLWLDAHERNEERIIVDGELADFICVYRVRDMKGSYEHPLNFKTDGYYLKSEDETYPDLLQRVDTLTTADGEKCVLFIDVSSAQKPAGKHKINVSVGEESASFELEVAEEKLVPTDLYLTIWVHMDGICNYYGVEPFSEEFYSRFKPFLKRYTDMGNNMMLLPAFTSPLDTAVGLERLTTQLVVIVKNGDKYTFDFSKMKRFIDLCLSYGIKYFEHSHLFTQWGAEFCPKIEMVENGESKKAFGWATRSESEEYKDFLSQYLCAFDEFLVKEGIHDRVFMHVTDEPRPEHLERYNALTELIRQNCSLKTIDAVSEKAIADTVDMPVVIMCSEELESFDDPKMLYYCVQVDLDHITNRFLHMPLQRTEILGYQLYVNRAKGFLHWGFNFYNTQFSTRPIDPYEDTMSGGGFPAGDGFIVYPGEDDAEPSVRYFSLKRAFEDYRLLKTLEGKIGKPAVLSMLEAEGVRGVHEYPRSSVWHEDFRARIIALIRGRKI